MALSPTDLLVTQRGATVYKVTADALSTSIRNDIDASDLPIATASTLGAIKVGANLSIDPSSGVLEAVLPQAISFKGDLDPADPAPSASPGDAFIVNADNSFDASFLNIAGQPGSVGDVVIYEGNAGHEWDLVKGLFGVGVISVKGADPIEVDSSDAANPVVTIKAADDAGQDGTMSSADKAKLDAIQPGADIGTVTEVLGLGAISVSNSTTTPEISVATSTSALLGVVRLADATAISLGTSERVVDASQLKVVSDDLASLDLKVDNLSLYTFLADDPIEVSVDASDNVTHSIKDATETQKGALRFATDAEAKSGLSDSIAVSALNGFNAYVPRDFSRLNDLP